MPSSTPAFAVLRTEVRRVAQLQALGRHNCREIPVRGVDPEAEGGFKVLRMDGVDAFHAVTARILKSGAKEPGKGRIYAFEVIASFSDNADPMPSNEVFEERSIACFDRMWGRENVVAAWAHYDEKGPHIHALGTPICLCIAPGRPCDDEEEPEKVLAVSWRQFCGSAEVDYRDPEKEKKPKKRIRKVQADKVKNRRNKVMAGWQTAYAEIWQDYGLRRGIPSNRGHMPIKWLHERLGAIAGRAEHAMDGIAAAAATLELTNLELLKLRQNPTPETVSELVRRYVLPEVEARLGPLMQEAARGIQLDNEKKARADLSDEHDGLKKRYQDLLAATSGGQPGTKELLAENANLRDELGRMAAAFESPDSQALLEQVGHLSDVEFDRLTKARKASRHLAAGNVTRPNGPPKLPTPEPKAQEPSGPSPQA